MSQSGNRADILGLGSRSLFLHIIDRPSWAVFFLAPLA